MTTKSLPSGIIAKTTGYLVNPKLITRRQGFNPRFDFGEISLLAKSIEANGLLMPIRVKRLPAGEAATLGKDFELVDGDRRLTAIELLMSENRATEYLEAGIPAILVDRSQDDITSLIQMFEANTGKSFLPLEEAAAFKRMRDAGMTIADICKRVGRADVHVTDTLALLEADDSVKEALASGQIGATDAKVIATAAKGDKEAQADLVKDAKVAKAGKGKTATGKAARAAFTTKVQQKKAARAAAKGKTLKIRALTDDQLSAIGAKVGELLMVKMKEAFPKTPMSDQVKARADFRDTISKDEALAAAYTFGALEGLLAAAGQTINFDI